MTRLHVDLNIPDTVSNALREAVQQEAREQTVLALFRRGACSAGVAADLLEDARTPISSNSSETKASTMRPATLETRLPTKQRFAGRTGKRMTLIAISSDRHAHFVSVRNPIVIVSRVRSCRMTRDA
jgi:hypothetical protein